MQENYSENQTNFAAEEPLYESSTVPVEPPSADQVAVDTPQKIYQKNSFKIISSLMVIFLLIVFGVVAMFFTSKSAEQVLEPTPVPSTQPTVNDPIQQRINQLKVQLQEADPSDDSLPLPPVDLTLTLEE